MCTRCPIILWLFIKLLLGGKHDCKYKFKIQFKFAIMSYLKCYQFRWAPCLVLPTTDLVERVIIMIIIIIMNILKGYAHSILIKIAISMRIPGFFSWKSSSVFKSRKQLDNLLTHETECNNWHALIYQKNQFKFPRITSNFSKIFKTIKTICLSLAYAGNWFSNWDLASNSNSQLSKNVKKAKQIFLRD